MTVLYECIFMLGEAVLQESVYVPRAWRTVTHPQYRTFLQIHFCIRLRMFRRSYYRVPELNNAHMIYCN
jgi:hypothetical protein